MDPLSHDILAALHQKWLGSDRSVVLAEFFARGMNGPQRDEIEAKFGRTVAELAAEIEAPVVAEAAPEPEAAEALTEAPVEPVVEEKPKRRRKS